MNKPRHSILVVDDEPGMREMLSYELERDSCDVEAVSSGQAALAAVKRRKFDVAITDLKMPGMDGVATVEALRMADPDLEVIVATGYGTIETAVACMKRGAYDYIQKPYDLDELKLLLARALEKNHLLGVVALYDASRAILRTLDAGELLPLAATLAKRLLRADAAGVTQCALGGAPARTYGTDGRITALLPDIERRVAERGSALVLSKSDAPLGPFGSGLAYPLPAHGDLIGVLVALRAEDAPDFAASELHKGIVFANQLALALDNARLYGVLERKIDELVHTQERLVRAERLSMAGQLAGYVAHEINNPLSIVIANLEPLTEYIEATSALVEAAPNDRGAPAHADTATVREIVQEIRISSHRIAELVASFGTLAARDGRAVSEPIDLAAQISEWHEANVEARAAVTLDPNAPRPAEVFAYRGEIRAALAQILTYVASPEAAAAPDVPRVVTWAIEERKVRLIISSLAPRLEEEAGRLFDPRLHADPRSGGAIRLSMELTLAYEMVKRNGGLVAVHVTDGAVRLELEFPRFQD